MRYKRFVTVTGVTTVLFQKPGESLENTMNLSFLPYPMPEWVTPEMKAHINYKLDALKRARPASGNSTNKSLIRLVDPPPFPLMSFRCPVEGVTDKNGEPVGLLTPERAEGRFRMMHALAEYDNWVFQRVTCPQPGGYEYERTACVKHYGSEEEHKSYDQVHGDTEALAMMARAQYFLPEMYPANHPAVKA